MVAKFPDLTRGVSRKITNRKHISSQMYKQAAALYEHYDEILKAINDIGMIGNAKQKQEAVELLGRYAPDLATVKSQLSSTENYIQKLEARIDSDQGVIGGKNKELNEKNMELLRERNKVRKLEFKQKELTGLLDRIPKEILIKFEKSKGRER